MAAPATKPAKENRPKRFHDFLKTSARVFAEEGYEKASIRRISAEMGTSLSALYHYVSTKEELLYLIQRETFSSQVESLKRLLANIENPREKLRTMVQNHLGHFIENMNELRVCSYELGSLTGDAYEEVLNIRRKYFYLTRDVVKEILEEEENKHLDANLATLNLFGMLNWIHMWFDPKRNRSTDFLAEQITRLFLNGLKAEKREGESR